MKRERHGRVRWSAWLGGWWFVKALINSPLNGRAPRIFHALCANAVSVVIAGSITTQVVVAAVEQESRLWTWLPTARTAGADMRNAPQWIGIPPRKIQAEYRVCSVAVEADIPEQMKHQQRKEEQCWQ